jgi:hypothetical protein
MVRALTGSVAVSDCFVVESQSQPGDSPEVVLDLAQSPLEIDAGLAAHVKHGPDLSLPLLGKAAVKLLPGKGVEGDRELDLFGDTLYTIEGVAGQAAFSSVDKAPSGKAE